MKTVVYEKNQKVPVKVWAEMHEIEPAALQQLKNVASLPFVFKHVAGMPDVHFGKGATVGSVIATKRAVVPAAVGVDIGCGMAAVKLGVEPAKILDKAKEIRHSIERSIPVGFEGNKNISSEVAEWAGWGQFDKLFASKRHPRGEADLRAKSQKQLCSLGGGNHFIELCTDTTGSVWVMLHSGSRNIGKSLAEIHINEAKEEMKKLFISLPDPDLAYYAEGTDGYSQYMFDLLWAQEFALENREIMLKRILKDISHAVGLAGAPVPVLMKVNCHHNYAAMENHYGENVLITRKGAVRARDTDLGIIPGSMGTRSYIVRGKGNSESFQSCSHGAGRRMSRTQACKQFTIADLAKQTEGVECRKDAGVLDEIPGAYKDIDRVMENQSDLVEIIAELKQFVCIKG